MVSASGMGWAAASALARGPEAVSARVRVASAEAARELGEQAWATVRAPARVPAAARGRAVLPVD